MLSNKFIISGFIIALLFGVLPYNANAEVSCSYGLVGMEYGILCTGVNTANDYAIYDNSLNLLGTNNLSGGYFALIPQPFEYFDPNESALLEDISTTLRYFTLGDDIWYSFSGLISGFENPSFTLNLIDNPLPSNGNSFFVNLEDNLASFPTGLTSIASDSLSSIWPVLLVLMGTFMAFYILIKIQDFMIYVGDKKDKIKRSK